MMRKPVSFTGLDPITKAKIAESFFVTKNLSPAVARSFSPIFCSRNPASESRALAVWIARKLQGLLLRKVSKLWMLLVVSIIVKFNEVLIIS